MEVIRKFVKNRFGITIVKCCASCSHKSYNLCDAGYGEVSQNHLCPKWSMKENLKNAGKVQTKK